MCQKWKFYTLPNRGSLPRSFHLVAYEIFTFDTSLNKLKHPTSGSRQHSAAASGGVVHTVCCLKHCCIKDLLTSASCKICTWCSLRHEIWKFQGLGFGIVVAAAGSVLRCSRWSFRRRRESWSRWLGWWPNESNKNVCIGTYEYESIRVHLPFFVFCYLPYHGPFTNYVDGPEPVRGRGVG